MSLCVNYHISHLAWLYISGKSHLVLNNHKVLFSGLKSVNGLRTDIDAWSSPIRIKHNPKPIGTFLLSGIDRIEKVLFLMFWMEFIPSGLAVQVYGIWVFMYIVHFWLNWLFKSGIEIFKLKILMMISVAAMLAGALTATYLKYMLTYISFSDNRNTDYTWDGLPVFTNSVHFSGYSNLERARIRPLTSSVFLKTVEISNDCRTSYCTAVPPYSSRLQFCESGVVVFDKNQGNLYPMQSTCGAYHDRKCDLLQANACNWGMQN